MPADLHIHSNFSDGIDSPEELVKLAAEAGLKTISLTDHDIVDGIDRAIAKGREAGVEVIPGIELTTESGDAEIHILGYFMDHHDRRLLEVLEKIQKSRIDRIYKIAKKLKALKIDIDPDEVLAFSGSKSPGRPHVARVLVKRGFVSSFKEAFNRFLDSRSPAYVPHFRLSPALAIHLIAQVGGVAVFGHPAVSNSDDIIPELMLEGLKGIEVYYSGHNRQQTGHYLALAEKHGLLVTGGSDFHGAGSGREIKLGDLSIPDELVEKLRNEHLRGN